ncbi:10683_t:CDS:2 [Acaulospora colombiana]|uniref:10683_t:CDS:1 n=1 Tax=Acaulospora colombiana TaxID=27376 RepID=A0ACA9N9A7_9GLOM|nr:10683_t:CDS:2 [Acaulospora colombiana]
MARAHIKSPESDLDEEDPALLDLQAVENQVHDLDLDTEEQALEVLYPEAFETVTAPSPSGLPEEMEVDGTPMEVDWDITSPVPHLPNLSLPSALSRFYFGVLELVDFPGSPMILVCYACRKTLKTKDVRRAQRHYRENHENSSSLKVTLQPFPMLTGEMPVDLPDGGVDSEEEEQEQDEVVDELMEGDEALDSQDEERIPLRKWFQKHANTLSFPEPRPSTIIPAIPFFPLLDGFSCPFRDCPFAAFTNKPVVTHINQKHRRELVRDDEEYDLRPKCGPVQSLHYRQGRFSPFRIQDPITPTSKPLSIQQLVAERLCSRKKAPTGEVKGFQYANAFMLRFRYRSIYPQDASTWTKHVARLVPKVSLIHSPHQTDEEHMIVLGCLLYILKSVEPLKGSSLIESKRDNSSFKPLGRPDSTIRYCLLFSGWIVYILRCIHDGEMDPGLYIHPEHAEKGAALMNQVQLLLQDELAVTELHNITHLPREQYYVGTDPFICDYRYGSTILRRALGLFDVIHTLSMALITQPLEAPASIPELAFPVVRFFAWKAWDEYAASFRTPGALHGLFCQLQWAMRLVIYQQYQRDTQPRHGTTPSQYGTLCQLHDDYLRQDTLSPFGILQGQVRYSAIVATSIAYAPQTTPLWEERAVCISGRTVSLSVFSEMVQITLAKARQLFERDLLFGRHKEICQMENGYIKRDKVILDEPDKTGHGYTYFSANQCFLNCLDRLGSFIAHDSELMSFFTLGVTLDNQGVVWNLVRIRKWLQAHDAFVKLLAVLIYWASGQPCRLPELISLSVENLPERPRNLYAIQGHLMIVQTYRKALLVAMRD